MLLYDTQLLVTISAKIEIRLDTESNTFQHSDTVILYLIWLSWIFYICLYLLYLTPVISYLDLVSTCYHWTDPRDLNIIEPENVSWTSHPIKQKSMYNQLHHHNPPKLRQILDYMHTHTPWHTYWLDYIKPTLNSFRWLILSFLIM